MGSGAGPGPVPEQYSCHRVTTLKLVGQADAQQLLEKVSWQVQPIMRKHSWSVGVLAEFLPKNEGLLGMNTNRGQKIQVRLRRRKDDAHLMDYESVLGTMLHELVHCQIGPHSAAFYKVSTLTAIQEHGAAPTAALQYPICSQSSNLHRRMVCVCACVRACQLLDELRDECDALIAKNQGGSGAGFDAVGSKLSTASHNPRSAHEGRLKAVAAAERRWQAQQLCGAAPQRLGGRRPASVLPPAQMAALAATRRASDDKWCPSHSLAVGADWLEVIDDDDDDDGDAAATPAAAAATAAVGASSAAAAAPPARETAALASTRRRPARPPPATDARPRKHPRAEGTGDRVQQRHPASQRTVPAAAATGVAAAAAAATATTSAALAPPSSSSSRAAAPQPQPPSWARAFPGLNGMEFNGGRAGGGRSSRWVVPARALGRRA
eukprot:COSAG01_NODE_1508_length_10054_cov_3.434713_10_plen_437_part_00